MTITKLGHCCLVIKEKSLTILTDPGKYTTAQDEIRGIDVILVTHEHADHLHVDSLKTILKNNPSAKAITNNSVGKILDKEGIPYELLIHGQNTSMKEVLIEGFGERHAMIYSTWAFIENTGYCIENRFFYPGDALTDPGKPVEILALPVAGPWIKISESVDYALSLKPKKCFPVHDGGLKHIGGSHFVPQTILPEMGIQFIIPEEWKEMEF